MEKENRHIKIFISSTFQDMQQEREILIKEVFLELKKTAKQRDVEITEIDLRWGITKEAADSGKTVKICLDEIDRCKDSPIFFLGMIGNRYGWSQWYDKIGKHILNDIRYSWIENYKDKSITELEIRYVLNKIDRSNKVLLYFKEDGKICDDSVVRLKKELTKLSVTKHNMEIEEYQNLAEFREKVNIDLHRILDELFPADMKLTEEERLYAPHLAFAREHQRFYVPNELAHEKMNRFLESNKNVFILTAKEGIGKSSFLANYFKSHDPSKTIVYYVGCGDEQEDLKKILISIARFLDFFNNIEINSNIDKCVTSFLDYLSNTPKELMIVIDGINNLKEKEMNIFLHHLKEEFEGKNTLSKIAISTRNEQHQFSVIYTMSAMKNEDKQRLIKEYLLAHGKKLLEKDIDRIVKHPSSDNIEFQKILLNEIRIIGNFDSFYIYLNKYLNVTDTIALFDRILLRFEEDYGAKLTQNILSSLFLARDGLSEDELFGLVNVVLKNNRLSRLDFSPIFLSVVPYMVNIDGFYFLKNIYLQKAVENRYLVSRELENEQRMTIAHFFWDRDFSYENNKRAVRETIYQIYKMGDMESVAAFLLIPMTFFHLISFDRKMLFEYVVRLNSLDSEESFLQRVHVALKNESIPWNARMQIADFFSYDMGAKSLAVDILHDIEKELLLTEPYDLQLLSVCYETIADNYLYIGRKWGDEKAKRLSSEYSKKAVEVLSNDSMMLAAHYYNEAKNLQYISRFEEAGLEKYLSSIKLKEKLVGELDEDVIFSYRDLGNICISHGLYAKADQFFTIAWERSKVHYGELSEQTYHAGKNIVLLYAEYSRPIISLNEFINENQKKFVSLNQEILDNLEEMYQEKSGWDNEDYEKLLEVSLLTLKNEKAYALSDSVDLRLSTCLMKAYYHLNDMENYHIYKNIIEKITGN